MPMNVEALRASPEFLNTLIDNIPSAVFLVDGDMRLKEFNASFAALFDTTEGRAVGELCGNAMGCMFAVREGNPCGRTSNCGQCELRACVLRAMVEKVPTHKERLSRTFYIGGRPMDKHFLITTRHIHYQDERMTMVIVDDHTETESQKLALLDRQRRLDADLEAAAEIQRNLLPGRLPLDERVRFAWRFKPCHTVGGDIFHVVEAAPGVYAMYMLDVAGHGVHSAMLTASVSQSLQLHSGLVRDRDRVFSPAEVLANLGEEYPFARFETHFTIAYALLDAAAGRLVCANAGHPPVIILDPDGEVDYLHSSGPFVGLGFSGYANEERLLAPGHTAIFITDGMTEYPDPPRRMLHQEGFVDLLRRRARLPVDDLLQAVEDDVLAFGQKAEPVDDMTMFAFQCAKEST